MASIESAIDTSINRQTRQRYDSMPYGNLTHTFSAPESLAAVASLFGVPSPPPATARVLDLGCASGFNLFPFALRNPEARCVGVDLSSVQIAAGIEAARKVGVTNLTLIEADLLQVDPQSLGQFDYIIAHGLYSWVPPPVQQAMFDVIAQCLAPEGVAYVSYNVYPGWKSKQVLRDAMLLHVGNETDVGKQVAGARSMVEFLLRSIGGNPGHPLAPLKDHLERAQSAAFEYLAHEYLEPFNLPCYFREFVERAEHNGLSFLSEAQVSMMYPPNYGDDVAGWLRGLAENDPVKFGQYADFAVNRTFRQSLLVHTGRARSISSKLDRKSLPGMHFAARLRCVEDAVRMDGSVQQFETPANQRMGVALSGLKQVMSRLTQVFPGTQTRDELIQIAAQGQAGAKDVVAPDVMESAIDELLEQLTMRGMCRVWHARVTAGTADAEVPLSDPNVRKLISLLPEGPGFIANAWHDTVDLTPLERELIPKLDGSMDRAALVEFVRELIAEGKIGLRAGVAGDAKAQAQAATNAVLNRMAYKGFLAR